MKNHQQGGKMLRPSHINCTRQDLPKICCQTTLQPFLRIRSSVRTIRRPEFGKFPTIQETLYKTEEGAKVSQGLYNIHGSFEVIVREYLVVSKNTFLCTHLQWHLASKAKSNNKYMIWTKIYLQQGCIQPWLYADPFSKWLLMMIKKNLY